MSDDGAPRAARTPPEDPKKAIVVSVTGDDAADGTSSSPVRTLGRALELSRADDTIVVGAGRYSAETLKDVRAKRVLVRGAAPGSATIDGLDLRGVSGLTFEDLIVRGSVLISDSVTNRPSSQLTFRRLRVSSPGELCFVVRGGSREVLIEDSHIFDCRVGIGGVATDPRSSDVVIRGNLLERFTGDGIQFGGWNDVRIDGNVIRKMADPLGETHNDGIQLTGNTRNVAITNNSITESNGQLLFIRDNFGPNDDLLVQNNLIARAGAYAVQNMGATRARYINNTIWYSRYGGLLLRRGGAKGAIAPRDTVVVNNILSGYAEVENATARRRGNNVVRTDGKDGPTDPAATDRVTRRPGFVAARNNDFRLRPRSVAARRADPRHAPKTDLAGRPRGDRPSSGALEVVLRQPATPSEAAACAVPQIIPLLVRANDHLAELVPRC